jgi:hypothetical protein
MTTGSFNPEPTQRRFVAATVAVGSGLNESSKQRESGHSDNQSHISDCVAMWLRSVLTV